MKVKRKNAFHCGNRSDLLPQGFSKTGLGVDMCGRKDT